jgi:hypothetical protein
MPCKYPLPIVIDSTMMACFRQCEQKFYKEFIRGCRPPGLSIDLHAGACFATALEVARRQIFKHNWPMEQALEAAHAQFMISWGDAVPPEGNQRKKAKNRDRVWEAVEDYFRVYGPLTDHIQPYILNGEPTLEFTFAIPLDFPNFPRHPTSGAPFVYGGRFDMLGSYGGVPIPLDEKTTVSISTGWAEQWNLRGQFIGYVWALQQQGFSVDSMCARGISLQLTQFLHAEAMPTYSRYIIDLWFEQLRRDLWKMVKMWEEDYFDFNLADACTQYGKCIFMDSCLSAEPENWLAQFEVRYWNPLEKNPAAGIPLPPQLRLVA